MFATQTVIRAASVRKSRTHVALVTRGGAHGALIMGMMVLLVSSGCATREVRVPHGGVTASPHRTAPPARVARQTPARPALPPRRVEVGRSVAGRPIELTLFGTDGERVLICGGIHGSEPTSADLAEMLVRHVRAHPELAAGRLVAILPRANPDGLVAGTRHNARGVDLNRNLPAENWRRHPAGRHGRRAGSEPETQALLTAIRLVRPERILSIHSIARGRHCNNFDGPAENWARRMAAFNGYPIEPSMGYPTPGSFGSWAGVDRAVPIVTLELPRDLSAEACWRENARALLAFIGSDVGVPALAGDQTPAPTGN